MLLFEISNLLHRFMDCGMVEQVLKRTDFAMLYTVIPEVSYAAVPAEEGVKEESEEAEAAEKKEKSNEAIDSTGRAAWDEISTANAVEIQDDKMQNVTIEEEGDYQVFKFIPTETKEYTFFSEGSYDTCRMLKSEDGLVDRYNDDRDEDENFSITAELTAGKTYYCVAQMLEYEYTGSFICMISSTTSRFTLSEENIKEFEITEYYNDTKYYRFENSVDDVPLGGYDYRITCMDDQIIEGYLRSSRQSIYGVPVRVRLKNEIEDGIADTTGGNALIYSLAGVEAEEIPITYVDSPIASMQVLTNPWTEVLPESEEDSNWIYPGRKWKNYDEDGNLAIGQNAIVFTYLGAVLEVPVTVVDIEVQSISVVRNPEKMTYSLFENTVDLFGLTLRVAYTDGTSEQVSVTAHSGSVRIGKCFRLMHLFSKMRYPYCRNEGYLFR